MAELIHQWNIPLDDKEHLIGWGDPIHLDITNFPYYMRVWTVEDTDVELPERPVRVIRSSEVLPEVSEALGGALDPSGHLWALVAVDEGTGPGPGFQHYSTSLTTAEGTLTATIVVTDSDEEDHDYTKILTGGIEHMRFLMATGVQD